MFLVEDRRPGLHNFVSTRTDPRKDGYQGNVTEGISLDYDMNAIHLWPDGERRPDPQLGRDPADPKHYKVFKFPDELNAARYEFVHYNAPVVVYSWQQYREMFRLPEAMAEKLPSDEWFDYIDETDIAVKDRRQKDVEPEPPPGSDLGRIAEWVAMKHMSMSGSIRQVLYLPSGVPGKNARGKKVIRLLEVSDRFVGADNRIEPIDFGVKVAGLSLTLSVADVSSDQLEMLKNDPSRLPRGWSLTGAIVFDDWKHRRLPA